MSQQSITFLSQSATKIKVTQKEAGGTVRFPSGNAGNLVLKNQTLQDKADFAGATKEAEIRAEAERPLKLVEFHYNTMRKSEETRKRLGAMDIPPKPVACLPGYSGFVPRKEAANIIGASSKKCNLAAAEVFAGEQEVWRKRIENIKGPASDLKTPPFVG